MRISGRRIDFTDLFGYHELFSNEVANHIPNAN